MSDQEDTRRQHMQRVVRAAFTYRSAVDGYYRAEAELVKVRQNYQGDSHRLIALGSAFERAKADMAEAEFNLVSVVDEGRAFLQEVE